jgi:hypothetical protein
MTRFLLELLSKLVDRNELDSGIGYDRVFTWLLHVLQAIAAVLSILRFFG